jgi:phage terminase large subunit GpA-like protein
MHDFYAQLTSETFHTEYKLGRPVRKWVLKRGVRNEVLDCWILAYAAKLSLKGRSSMLAPPKPQPVKESAATVERLVSTASPTSPTSDKVEPRPMISYPDRDFTSVIRKRKSIAHMLASVNSGTPGNHSGWGR